MEIRTPKIIPGESEGGAGVFTTDYFGRVRLRCFTSRMYLYRESAYVSLLRVSAGVMCVMSPAR